MRLPLIATLLLAACEPAVSSTYVVGKVLGVTFTSPNAISHIASSSIFDQDTVLITDVPGACRATASSNIGASEGVTGPGGTRGAALIFQGGAAYLDPGGSAARVTATTAKIIYLEDRSDGTRLGRFDVEFGSEKFVGDFIAPPCAALRSGCDATAVAVLPALALLVWARVGRRRRQP